MNKVIVMVAGLGLAATFAGCCGGGGSSSQPSGSAAPVTVSPLTPATPVDPTKAVMPGDPTKAMPMPGDPTKALPAPTGGSNFGTVTLTTGFMPDPNVAGGTSGGAIDASTLNPSCRGWISGQPDHLFVAQSAFSNLRILVRSDGDTTLVVQGPDGMYRCNDDSEGFNPAIPGPFAPGTYRIWVGSYSQGTLNPYRIAFTELASVTASSL